MEDPLDTYLALEKSSARATSVPAKSAEPSIEIDPIDAFDTARESNISAMVNDDKFDAPMHAAQNPQDADLAYEVENRKNARPIGKKVASAFSDPKGTAGGAIQSAWNFITGIPKVLGDSLERDARNVKSKITGEDDPRILTLDAESMLTGQHGEESVKSTGRSVANFLERIAPPTEGMEDVTPEAQKAADESSRRENFDARVEAAKKQISLAEGKPLDSGVIASAFEGASGVKPSEAYGPETLKAFGSDPVDHDAIAKKSAASDPNMLLLSAAPELPGARLAAGRIAQGLGKVAQIPGQIVDKIPIGMIPGGAKRILGKGLTVGNAGAGLLGVEAAHKLAEIAMSHPIVAAKVAGGAVATGLGAIFAKGAQKVGQAVEAQGKEMATGIPSELSTRVATGRIEAARNAGKIDFKAEIGRKIGNAPSDALATGIGMIPLNAVLSDGDGKKLADSTVGAMGFGATLGAMHSARPILTEAARPYLRSEGARMLDKTSGLGQKTAEFLVNQPEEVMDSALEMMGAMSGMATEGDGGEKGTSQIYIVDNPTYQAEIAKLGTAPGDGGQGFVAENGIVVINGDFAGGDGLGHVMGHEGTHLARQILTASQGKGGPIWKSMMDHVSDGVIKNGVPTPEFAKFIKDYNLAFDPSGATKRLDAADPASIEEFLAEHAGRVTATDGAAGLALPKTIIDRLQENISRWAKKAIGLDADKIGGQTGHLNANELGEATRLIRETFEQIAQSPRTATEADQPAASAPPEAANPDPAVTPPAVNPVPVAAPPVAPAAHVVPNGPPPWLDGSHGAPIEPVPSAPPVVAPAPITVPPPAKVAPIDLPGQHPNSPAPIIIGGQETPKELASSSQTKSAITGELSDIKPSEKQDAGGAVGAKTDVEKFPVSDPSDSGVQAGVSVASKDQIAQARKDGEKAAQPRVDKARGGARTSKEQRQAEIKREARVDALADLLPKESETDFSVRTDPDTGEQSIRGKINPKNPLHTAILEEFNYSPENIKHILDLQANTGKGIYLRDYKSAEQEGFEQGDNLDNSGTKRGEEYSYSPTSKDHGQREGLISKQDKGFTPIETTLTGKGVTVRGFDHDKFLSNLRYILDAAKGYGQRTGLEGLKGAELDTAISKGFRGVTENNANGRKGNGDALKVLPDSSIRENPDYAGQKVDNDLANVINMAMHNRSARPPNQPRGKTDLAAKKFAKAIDRSKEAIGTARLNDGFFSPEGETNPLRQSLENSGFDADKTLKPTISNIRPDLIEGGVSDTPTHGKSVHAHGFDIAPAELTAKGFPRGKLTAAGFLPGPKEGQLSDFGKSSKAVKERDESYLKAVRDNDISSAKKMTDDAAIEAGYDKIGWHGTSSRSEIADFDLSKEGSEAGVFFTNDAREGLAFADWFNRYGRKRVNKFYLKGDLAEYDANRELFDPSMMEGFMKSAREDGKDGAIIRNIQNFEGGAVTDTTVVFDPNQAKSSRPITRDDAGEVIPLSRRFNSGGRDIRFLPGSKELSSSNETKETILPRVSWYLKDGKRIYHRREADGTFAAKSSGQLASFLPGPRSDFSVKPTDKEQFIKDILQWAPEPSKSLADHNGMARAWMTKDGGWINVAEHRDAVPQYENADTETSDVIGAGLARVTRDGEELHVEHHWLTPKQLKELKDTAAELDLNLRLEDSRRKGTGYQLSDFR